MPGPTKYSPDQLRRALENCDGDITATAEALKIQRETIYRMMRQFPELADVVQEARERLVDDAESVFGKAMRDYATTDHDSKDLAVNAAKFVASRLGKHRGWGEKTEIELVGGIDGVAAVKAAKEAGGAALADLALEIHKSLQERREEPLRPARLKPTEPEG